MPDSLLIYERGGKLQPYSEIMIDNIISAVGGRANIPRVSNHDLRRMRGRMMYHAKVPLEVVVKIFGHSDTKTTIRYLGLDFDDMHLAMGQYAQYQKEVLLPKVVKNRTEPVGECGGTGI